VRAAGTVLALAVALGSSARLHSAAAEDTQLKDAPGRELTVGRCTVCHSLEYIPANAAAQNRSGWQKTIQKMRERFGAPISDDEAKEILDYLDANYSGKKD
jgi:hypothetical protein